MKQYLAAWEYTRLLATRRCKELWSNSRRSYQKPLRINDRLEAEVLREVCVARYACHPMLACGDILEQLDIDVGWNCAETDMTRNLKSRIDNCAVFTCLPKRYRNMLDATQSRMALGKMSTDEVSRAMQMDKTRMNVFDKLLLLRGIDDIHDDSMKEAAVEQILDSCTSVDECGSIIESLITLHPSTTMANAITQSRGFDEICQTHYLNQIISKTIESRNILFLKLTYERCDEDISLFADAMSDDDIFCNLIQ